VLESADSRALKALGPQGREGSSPSSGTISPLWRDLGGTVESIG
jgi:hypothetical protein